MDSVEAQRRKLEVEYTLNAVSVESEPPMQRNNDCVYSAWQRPCVHAESGRGAGEEPVRPVCAVHVMAMTRLKERVCKREGVNVLSV